MPWWDVDYLAIHEPRRKRILISHSARKGEQWCHCPPNNVVAFYTNPIETKLSQIDYFSVSFRMESLKRRLLLQKSNVYLTSFLFRQALIVRLNNVIFAHCYTGLES